MEIIGSSHFSRSPIVEMWDKPKNAMLSPTHHKDTEVEELIEDNDEEEVAAPEEPLLKLSELTQLSQREIDFHQYIKKLLEESVEVISQIIKDQS